MSFRIIIRKIIVFLLIKWCFYSKRILCIFLVYTILMLAGIILYYYVFTNLNTRLGYFQMF
jgi:hypothetical protein